MNEHETWRSYVVACARNCAQRRGKNADAFATYADDLYLTLYVHESNCDSWRAAFMTFGRIGIIHHDWENEQTPE